MSEARQPSDRVPVDRERAQRRLVLTAHPLQRIGGFCIAALAGEDVAVPESLSAAGFDTAVARMTADAVATARVPSTKADDGFWLKASLSLFPNAPMNHPGRLKHGSAALAETIGAWRTMPHAATWPNVACALCGRESVGFYGKRDVPLAESESYRNTTPRGSAGLALCWPCLCCFYALPYGCRLTGGPSSALHSWDDRFTARTVALRVAEVSRSQALGVPPGKAGPHADEVAAVRLLRGYDQRLRAGIELLVFSNNNQQQSLERHALDEPLARWLHSTVRDPAGFRALLAAHRTSKRPGYVELARLCFRSPRWVASGVSRYIGRHPLAGGDGIDHVVALGPLYRSFLTGVMGVRTQDVDEIDQLAGRIAQVVVTEPSGALLRSFRAAQRKPSELRHWLRRQGYRWLLDLGQGSKVPLVTDRQFLLLFDPDGDAWLYRELLMVSVVAELHRRRWRPDTTEGVADEDNDDPDTATADEGFIDEQGLV